MKGVDSGGGLGNEDARLLLGLLLESFRIDKTWWRTPPVWAGTPLLAWNGVMTPPMSFDTEDEARKFEQMHHTLMFLPIPKPPGYDEFLKGIKQEKENGNRT